MFGKVGYYVLIYATPAQGVKYTTYPDSEAGRKDLREVVLQVAGTGCLFYRIYREDTGNILQELVAAGQPKPVEGTVA